MVWDKELRTPAGSNVRGKSYINTTSLLCSAITAIVIVMRTVIFETMSSSKPYHHHHHGHPQQQLRSISKTINNKKNTERTDTTALMVDEGLARAVSSVFKTLGIRVPPQEQRIPTRLRVEASNCHKLSSKLKPQTLLPRLGTTQRSSLSNPKP